MIRNCSKCSRSYVFFEGQEGEWHEGWSCPYCSPPVLRPRPDPSDLLVAAMRQIVADVIVECGEAGKNVAARYPAEKATAYNAGFSAAMIAVAIRFGIQDIEVCRDADGVITFVALK